MSKFEEYKPIMSNKNMWKVTTSIPIELINDESFIENEKRKLIEILVKSYVEKVELSDLGFRLDSELRTKPYEFEISMCIDDLFNLKQENNRLRNEMSELVDKYIIMRDSK